MSEIPFERLGIPIEHRKALLPDAPLKLREAAASGALPVPAAVGIAISFALLGDSESSVRDASAGFLCDIDSDKLVGLLTKDTHPKLLEFLVENRVDDHNLQERVVGIRLANERTLRLIAQHGAESVLELLSMNQERLLLEPHLYEEMGRNPAMTAEIHKRMESFLRMHQLLDEGAKEDKKPAKAGPAPAPVKAARPLPSGEKRSLSSSELEAEIAAALSGAPAPVPAGGSLQMFDLDSLGIEGVQGKGADVSGSDLGDFEFSFEEESVDFAWSLISADKSEGGEEEEEEQKSIEQQIAAMTVGHKIKLAYTGNLSVRKILLRDSNKLVSSAVVKSGRMSDSELLAAAGNRNVPSEILNHISRNKEQMRKYPVRVALVTNPKTPVPIALKIMRDLSKSDLRSLSMNRNVSGVVFETATRLYKQKYQK